MKEETKDERGDASEAVDLSSLGERWRAAWPAALACWSPYVQLSEPTWTFNAAEDQRERITSSFAMIRLLDHRVVISLAQVAERHLEDFGLEILAHEIGHHIFCPADLTDNARCLARIRAGLPSKEHLAPMIANLYEDLLINDRLQRSNTLRMAEVFDRLRQPINSALWMLYMRTYEILWQLETHALAMPGDARLDERTNNDARLAARLIRSYGRDWLGGAGRFAALCLSYVINDDGNTGKKHYVIWSDTESAGAGGVPEGLVEIEAGELDAIHPSEDPELSGIAPSPDGEKDSAGAPAPPGPVPATTGIKTLKRHRGPVEYAQIIKAAGGGIPSDLITARYYRERALPHLIRFPAREVPNVTDPTPEALEAWDIGAPLERIDWMGTILVNPIVVPGLTTRERITTDAPGNTPKRIPLDLYLGIDCSGSMGNPAAQLSYPVLAGAIIALSALRAGAKVKVVLSGEPGHTISTPPPGFIRDEFQILKTLTDYLGTGTTFGIHRLADTFETPDARRPPAHILIVTDNDIFSMLDRKSDDQIGWDIAKRSATIARGGATYVLQLPAYLMNSAGAKEMVYPGEERMKADGWTIAHVDAEEEMIAFAKRFAQASYGDKQRRGIS